MANQFVEGDPILLSSAFLMGILSDMVATYISLGDILEVCVFLTIIFYNQVAPCTLGFNYTL